MKEKCNKYKSLFIFRNEKELMQHLEVCEDCRLQHEEMSKIDDIVRLAKPVYFRGKNKNYIYKLNKLAACFAFLFLLSFVSGNFNEIYLLHQKLTHPEVAEYIESSIFNQMKLPTDEYGLLDSNGNFYYD
jgi:hypothetical protein